MLDGGVGEKIREPADAPRRAIAPLAIVPDEEERVIGHVATVGQFPGPEPGRYPRQLIGRQRSQELAREGDHFGFRGSGGKLRVPRGITLGFACGLRRRHGFLSVLLAPR